MKIIENNDDLKFFFKLYKNQDSILIPISSDENKHPCSTDMCLLYIQMMSGEEFILPVNHSETLNIEVPNLKSTTKKYTYDKKQLNHFIQLDNVVDVNLLNYMATGLPLSIEETDTNAHQFFNIRYYRKDNLNTIIPVLKHLEKCRKIVKILKGTIKNYSGHVNMSYNNDVLDNLGYIEKNGIQTTNELVFSEYNIFTSTGRPSNRFGGINFAALNKSDGSRKQFISRFKNGILVEYDYSAYHPSIIADIVGYKFEGDVYKHLGKYYGVDREESKILTFQYLYGHIPLKVIESNPFFKLVSDFINEMWKEYKNKEFIESYIYSKKIFRKNLSGMNRNKLFNYLLQLTETEMNSRMLTNLIPFIKQYKSKLILYSYDSFLFDYCLDDGIEFLREVKTIIESNGLFPTKVSKGLNYHEMEDITEKL
jgi:hypothetical protein